MNTFTPQDLVVTVEQCRLLKAKDYVEVVLGCTYKTAYVSFREVCPFFPENLEADYVQEALRRSKSVMLTWIKEIQSKESIVGSIVTLDETFFQESDEEEKENKRSRDTFEMDQTILS